MEKKQFNPLKMTDASVIDVWVTWPDEKDKYPGILLLDEGFGVNEHIKSVAERLSREGYVVFVPDLYHRLGRQLQLSYGDTTSVQACTESIRIEELAVDLKTTLSAMESLHLASIGTRLVPSDSVMAVDIQWLPIPCFPCRQAYLSTEST